MENFLKNKKSVLENISKFSKIEQMEGGMSSRVSDKFKKFIKNNEIQNIILQGPLDF